MALEGLSGWNGQLCTIVYESIQSNIDCEYKVIIFNKHFDTSDILNTELLCPTYYFYEHILLFFFFFFFLHQTQTSDVTYLWHLLFFHTFVTLFASKHTHIKRQRPDQLRDKRSANTIIVTEQMTRRKKKKLHPHVLPSSFNYTAEHASSGCS